MTGYSSGVPVEHGVHCCFISVMVSLFICSGEHLDTTFRGWSSTLAARVRLVISRLVLIFALPLDFHGRVRVVRSMYLPAALHGS